MANAIKIAAIAGLVLCVSAGVWWLLSSQTDSSKQAPANTSQPTPTIPATSNSASLAKPVEPQQNATPHDSSETPLSAPEKIESALQSMSTSLSQGDSRTPELAPQFEREKPSAEVLADPARYSEYELAQTKKIAAIYLSMLGQIPILRARIDAAKSAGSKTDEEIAEAEEALAKLEALKRDIELNHPDMLPNSENSAPPDDIDQAE